jgi:hypothetical protein
MAQTEEDLLAPVDVDAFSIRSKTLAILLGPRKMRRVPNRFGFLGKNSPSTGKVQPCLRIIGATSCSTDYFISRCPCRPEPRPHRRDLLEKCPSPFLVRVALEDSDLMAAAYFG